MPPAGSRRSSFRRGEAPSPTVRSTLPSRRAARGPVPRWGVGLLGTVMSLVALCRLAGNHRHYHCIARDSEVPNTILIKSSSPPLRFTPNKFLFGGSTIYAPLDPTLTLNGLPVGSLFSDRTYFSSMPCKLSLGGPCSTEVAAPPTESIRLPSRLPSLSL